VEGLRRGAAQVRRSVFSGK